MKAVFHINELNKIESLNANLVNMKRYDERIEIIVVANGEAVKLFTQSPKLIEGITYHICNNALKAHEIDPKKLDKKLIIVPSGVVDLLELQNQGFAYIKP